MTSRRPTSVLSVSPRSSSVTKQQQQQQQDTAKAEQKPGEDTPIVSRASTPRSYRSTENGTSSGSTPSDERNPNGTQQQQRHYNHQVEQDNQQVQRDESSGGNEDDDDPKRPWYKKAAEKYGSLELENKGSVARDHLALERTFLAWLRTSLAFASIGIAITQLFRLNTSISPESSASPGSSISQKDGNISPILPPRDALSSSTTTLAPRDTGERLRSLGKPIGATFIGIAVVVLLVGFHRYFESQYWVVRGKFPASRGSIAIVAGFTAALMIVSLVVILAVAPGALEA